MSERIPESIPTSAYRRPVKRARTTETSSQQQSSNIEALFANPERVQDIPVGPQAKTLAPPPELVTNVQGSSAGAGSGEFHVYKASRRREYERLRMMDEEVETEQADRAWEEKREEVKRKEDAKLNKNRARREKAKARQAKAKNGDQVADNDANDGVAPAQAANGAKKKLTPAVVAQQRDVQANNEQADAVNNTTEGQGITFMEDD